MLSEVGHSEAVAAVTPFLRDPELREDARCVLLRIPDRKAIAVLESAHQSAPPDFKEALAYSLNQRGRNVADGASPRAPVKKTTVTQISPPDK
jgi:hypothetical protein